MEDDWSCLKMPHPHLFETRSDINNLRYLHTPWLCVSNHSLYSLKISIIRILDYLHPSPNSSQAQLYLPFTILVFSSCFLEPLSPVGTAYILLAVWPSTGAVHHSQLYCFDSLAVLYWSQAREVGTTFLRWEYEGRVIKYLTSPNLNPVRLTQKPTFPSSSLANTLRDFSNIVGADFVNVYPLLGRMLS